MIELRPIRKSDETFLFRVYASTREEELQWVDWDEKAGHEFLTAQFNAQHIHYMQHYPNADFQIILQDHEPIGRLYVDRRGDEIRLVDIALLPEFRHEGIGTGLIRDLIAEARSRELPVRIHVEKLNPAIRLYERLGFRKVEDKGVYRLLEWIAS